MNEDIKIFKAIVFGFLSICVVIVLLVCITRTNFMNRNMKCIEAGGTYQFNPEDEIYVCLANTQYEHIGDARE